MANIVGAHQHAAHCAGLLHDSGRLGLVSQHRGIYIRMLEAPTVEDPDLRLREREVFGMDHTEVGLAMFDQLGLPTSLRGAIARHHDSFPEGDTLHLERLVQAACRVATATGFGAVARPTPLPDVADVLEGTLLSFPERERARLTPRMNDAVGTVATMMEAFELVL
jgi:HD-like signal output (HDOD) protein